MKARDDIEPGDVALLFLDADVHRKDPVSHIADHYLISREEAALLIRQARKAGLIPGGTNPASG